MNIGIVGGGLMGLALAVRLSRQGHAVSVFERDSQLGGLATYHDFGEFVWDRFYHVILPSDTYLIDFIRELGLEDKLRWQKTLTGFYVDRQFHSLSNSVEFLRFRPLSLWSKFRLGLTILYCSRINDWRRLEKVRVEDWLLRTSGRATYEKLWKPLLLAKLGDNYRRVSAVFIWSYVKRMFSARDSSAQTEQMGYVSGGYRTVFCRLEELIATAGGRVRKGVTVSRVESAGEKGLILRVEEERLHFDKVVFTSPVNVLQRVAAPGLVKMDGDGADVEYLGVVCPALITRKPLTPYYILNIADPEVPFTGVIGMTNVVSVEETGGLHLAYLPKYVLSTDPILSRPEADLRELFMTGLHRMFPDLDRNDVHSMHINRAIKVQPLQVLNYSELVPKCETLHPDFFVLNTAQFVNNTLNNNQVIKSVEDFLAEHGSCFAGEEVRADGGPEMVSAAS